MARRRIRDLARTPGFRPGPRVRLTDRMYEDIGITEPYVDEYEGREYVTPSIINDDRKEQ